MKEKEQAVKQEPAAWLHEITEPNGLIMVLLSRLQENPWGHWMESYKAKCQYRATPLYPHPAQSGMNEVAVPRQTLTMIYEAMNHMGDVLNGMDAVEAEDEEICSPAFDAIRALLALKQKGEE